MERGGGGGQRYRSPASPVNTKHLYGFIQRRPNVEDVGPTLYKCYIVLMLGQRRRRWPNNEPALDQRPVYAGLLQVPGDSGRSLEIVRPRQSGNKATRPLTMLLLHIDRISLVVSTKHRNHSHATTYHVVT